MNFLDLTKPYENEKLYIAGPEVFYHNGNKKLSAMRALAESYGLKVSLPNDVIIKADVEQNPNAFADEIFDNCATSMNDSTAIIVDLEDYRGVYPDGGSVYELGMAWARGMRCYAFSRDCRPAAEKDWLTTMREGIIYDQRGWEHAYPFLPFSPLIVGSAHLIEGNFEDSLKQLISDISYDYIHDVSLKLRDYSSSMDLKQASDEKRVYVSSALRYSPNAQSLFNKFTDESERYGYEFLVALPSKKMTDPFTAAGEYFNQVTQAIRNCDIFIADLDEQCGLEPDPDVSFETGMAYQLGKKIVGVLSNAQNMLERVPNHGKELDYRDSVGRVVEFYDYPINLMFSSSMRIFEGRIESVFGDILNEMKRNV